jgi:transglutaminase-like putative cysteine protease
VILPSSVRVALAAWLASVLAAVTIFPLVQGQGWFVDVALLAALTAGAGLAVRRVTTSPPVVVGVQILVWVVAVCMIFLNRTAWLGVLPGPDALDSGQQLFAQGLRVMHRAAPPVSATAGVVFVTAAGLSLIALLVDVLAVTVRRPAVAGLPLLAVYCVPAAVLRDGLSWPLFLLAGAGFLLLVAVDSVDRVQAWGRVLSGPTSSRSSLSMVFAGARRLAGVSLALAVVLPLLVPGIGERVLTGRGTGTGPGDGTVTVLNPLLRLRQDLGARDDTPLLTYTTTMTSPQPLRVVVDDEFRGDYWQPSTGEVPRENKVQNVAPLPEGLDPGTTLKPEQTRITVSTLTQNYLPVPFPWRQIDVQGNWIFDAKSQVVLGEGATSRGLRYTVDHYMVQATPDQLRAAAAPDPAVVQRYTALPSDLPNEIRRLARVHGGLDGTPYDQAERLRSWLRTFKYSEQAPGDGTSDSGSNAVLAFLKAKSGYCVHFASAMAVMARTLDIPARVVVGFLPGTRGADGTWTVSLRDAHAWPELYFQGYGWVRFEPTPAARTSGVPDVVESNQDATPLPSSSASAPVPDATPSASANSRLPKEDQADDSAAGDVTELSPWQRVVGVLTSPWTFAAVLVLLALSLPMVVVALARRARWRRASTRAARAEAALDELSERLGDLGVPLSAARTPRGVRQWLVGAEYVPPDRTAPLDRIVTEVEAARYAPPGGDGPNAEHLHADVKAVAKMVAEQVPAGRRRLARLLPPSGLSLLTGAASRADAAMEGAGERAAGQVGHMGQEVRKFVGSGRKR